MRTSNLDLSGSEHVWGLNDNAHEAVEDSMVFIPTVASVTSLRPWGLSQCVGLLLSSLLPLLGAVPAQAQCWPGSGGMACGNASRPDALIGLPEQTPTTLSLSGPGSITIENQSKSEQSTAVVGPAPEPPMSDAALLLQRLSMSTDGRPPAPMAGNSTWTADGVQFRLDDAQALCSVNKQGPSMRPCR